MKYLVVGPRLPDHIAVIWVCLPAGLATLVVGSPPGVAPSLARGYGLVFFNKSEYLMGNQRVCYFKSYFRGQECGHACLCCVWGSADGVARVAVVAALACKENDFF